MTEVLFDAPPATGGLFLRAAAGALPVPIPGLTAKRSPEVSGDVLVLADVATDVSRLAAFNRLCGYPLESTVPAVWPHILAFPLQLALLTDPAFPFPAIGLVHIHNRIRVLRPIGTGESLTLKVWAEPLVEHPRGRAVPVRTEAWSGDELVWEETALNLRIGAKREGVAAPVVASSEGYGFAARWKLGGDTGRRYAAVAGDYNPIHLHPLTARPLGFPRAIAHGFYSKARALAQLHGRLPNQFTVEVAFKRPILLPASVDYVESVGGDAGIGFGVRNLAKGVPHLDGWVSF